MKKLSLLFALALVLSMTFFGSLSYADSPRMVIVEEGTNASCGPCAAQNPSFQEWVESNTAQVIPLVYHAWWPGANDPMYLENTVMNKGRIGTYYGWDQEGVPICRVNGAVAPSSGSYYEGAPGDIQALNTELAKYTGATSPITITIEQVKNGNKFDVNVKVKSTSALSGVKLRVAMVEYHIFDDKAGNNGETDFFWVARKMLPDHSGTTMTQSAGEEKSYPLSTVIPNTWDEAQMYVVVFIQDDATKEVLQAAHNLAKTTLQATVEEPFLKVNPNEETSTTVRVTNPNNADLNCTFAIDATGSVLPAGWNATVTPATAYIKKGEYKDVVVKITAPDGAGFVQVMVKASPVVTSGISESAKAYVYALSTKSKIALYLGANAYIGNVYQALMGVPGVADQLAAIPLADVTMQAYPPADMFDLAILPVDYANRGLIGASLGNGIANQLISLMLAAGKHLLVSSELDLYNAYSQYGTSQGKAFFANTLKIKPFGAAPTQRYSGSTLTSFPVTGVADDEIGDGFQATFNTSTNGYVLFTDLIEIVDKAKTKPFIYADNNKSNITGVYTSEGTSNIVFMTTGVEANANATTRTALMTKIMAFLMGGSAPGGAEIASDEVSLDFSEVMIGQSSTKEVKIKNVGDENLLIDEIYWAFEEGVFELVDDPSFPIAIEPQSELTIKVKFTPVAEADYTDLFSIVSNAVNGEYSITCNGKGIPAVGVVDPTISSNGIFSMNAGPNPFVEKTTVNYSVSGMSEQQVNIQVIDASGKLVATLVNGMVAPGEYHVDFTASNFASGVYHIVANVAGESIQVPVALTR